MLWFLWQYKQLRGKIKWRGENSIIVISINTFVKFFYNNGTYGLRTTGGNPDNPNDNDKKLIYGTGNTSYTTIRIDGVNHRFQPDSVTKYDNKIIGTKRYGEIIVSQHISIISNQYIDREDVVEFLYTVENTGDTDHDVGNQ